MSYVGSVWVWQKKDKSTVNRTICGSNYYIKCKFNFGMVVSHIVDVKKN